MLQFKAKPLNVPISETTYRQLLAAKAAQLNNGGQAEGICDTLCFLAAVPVQKSAFTEQSGKAILPLFVHQHRVRECAGKLKNHACSAADAAEMLTELSETAIAEFSLVS